MIIGIIGSGGREHAICAKILESKKVDRVYCFPGNAGTNLIATNIEIKVNEFEKIKDFVLSNKIDFLVVGPEKPLVDGIVNYFQKNNIKIFGPEKLASQLEGSKIFTKKLCKKYNIPTAKFGIFEKIKEANLFLKNSKFPIVVKADGLAAGKGVYICEDIKEAIKAVDEIFNGKFGMAKNILIEEFLSGEEMSYFIISDGKNYKKFQTAQDHKRVLEGDKGKNTGGMGAYSPSRLINKDLDEKIIKKIIEPTIKGLKEMNTKFIGFLYAGLMIINNEPYLIEYNVRMGDPECQTILPKLKTELVDIFAACCEGKLDSINIEWHDEKSLCIVLCSKGYPDKYENNLPLSNLNKIHLKNNEFIYHAGTKTIKNEVYSNGGRVLNFVVLSNNFKNSKDKAIQLIKKLDWHNSYYRRDIGFKVIE
ncbi:MAG TPA: phosphoribosylamine--glycine ligase [Candidatus Pelagibacter bacterium]|jgi:phosphoribosylamine--glycine ligase|nr:phosphoribosylamine--glycine ligase [Candidatus Pelagibacter bacterium]|tara:strand:+ start:5901 stop:7163 length:1263 start_codon:yes stop_codon:yes gene_type:complete